MNIVKNGNDYEPQSVSTWRLRELVQHEKDNTELRAQINLLTHQQARLREQIEALSDNVVQTVVVNNGWGQRRLETFARTVRDELRAVLASPEEPEP